MRLRLLIALAAVSAAQLAAQPTPPGGSVLPALAFGDEVPVVTGVTPGGRVIWLLVGKEYDDGTRRLVRRDGEEEDADKDGRVALEVGQAVPAQSVWVAVDLSTGLFAVATPDAKPVNRLELPEGSLRPGAASADELFADGRWFLHLLLVRAGSGPLSGAWRGIVGDGGIADLDGEGNGRLRLSLAGLEPLHGSPELTPAVVKPGDVLVAIAPDSLETFATRIAGKPQG